MPKTKISEYSSNPANNTDIDGINIAEGMAPSDVNNAIRELMSQLKDFQTGASGDAFTFAGGVLISGSPNTVSGSLVVSGNINSSGTTNTFSGGNILSGTNTISGSAIISGNINSSGTNTFSGNNVFSSTGSIRVPVGTEAQRPVTPLSGMFRFNDDADKFEGYNGTAWGAVGGGATGAGGDEVFYENGKTVTANYTITSNRNAMSAGAITINSGVSVTIPSGSRWVIV